MSDGFDPYRKWLGIRPKDQPPHHYRLLGIDLFEDDSDIIENSADRQMLLVRTFASGPHSEVSQRLLNEISAAKVVLLNRPKKVAYDAELRQRLTPTSPTARAVAAQPVAKPAPVARRAVPAAQPLPAARPAPREDAFDFKPSAPSPATSQMPGAKPLWQQPILWGGLAAGLVLMVAVVVLATRDRDQQTAERPDEPPEPPSAVEVPDAEVPFPTIAPPQQPPQPEPPGPEIPPEQPPVIPAPVVAGQMIDLLKLVDVDRDAVKGEWALENGVLMSPVADHARLLIPYEPPAEYSLDVVVQVKGNRGFSFGLVGDGNQFLAVLDGWDPRSCGLHLLDGKESNANESTRKVSVLTSDTVCKINYSVRREGVTVICDGKTAINWRGRFGRLSMSDYYVVPNKDTLLVACHFSECRFHSIRLTAPGTESPLITPEPEVVVKVDDPTVKTPVTQPPQKAKLAVPDDAAQERARREIEDLFAADISAAQTGAQQAALAKRWLEQGSSTQNDPAARYTLLWLAATTAATAGAANTTREALNAMADTYDADAWQLRAAALETAAKEARGANFKEKSGQLARVALALAEDAVDADRYEAAEALLDHATASARRAKEVALIKQLVGRRKEVDQIAAAYLKAEQALAALKRDPQDPEANLGAGRFLCFPQGSLATRLAAAGRRKRRNAQGLGVRRSGQAGRRPRPGQTSRPLVGLRPRGRRACRRPGAGPRGRLVHAGLLQAQRLERKRVERRLSDLEKSGFLQSAGLVREGRSQRIRL